MYALSLDMDIEKLKKCCIQKDMYKFSLNKENTDPYNEIRVMISELGFDWTQGSLYISRSDKNNLTSVYKVINKLSSIKWFKELVKDIRAFKVEDWSDFTEVVKSND